MSSVVAVVKSIIGQVVAVSPEGAQRVLVEGDRIYQGEQLVTGAAGAVTLDTGDGRTVDLGRDSQWSGADLPHNTPAHAQAQPTTPSTEDLQKAIAAGLGPTQALAPTAAGPSAASSGGSGVAGGSHSFVMLDETAGRVDPTVGFPTAGAGQTFGLLQQEQALLADTSNQPSPNNAPQGQDAALVTDEDTPVSGRLVANDPDGNPLRFDLGDSPRNGTVVVNPDGTYTYTPGQNFNGNDSFTVIVDDGQGGRDTITVNVGVNPVNDAPVAVNDGPVSVTEDTPATGNVLANDTDVDGDVLTVTGFTFGGTTVNAGQTATVNGVGSLVIKADGSFIFTPAPNYNGPVPTATYTITDGSITASAKLSFSDVTPVNDAPVAVNDGPVSVTEDTPATGNVLANDSDPEGDALTVTGFTFGGTTVNAGQSATINGVGSLVINSDGSFTFTPAPDYNGPVPTATYTVSDGKLSSTAALSFANVTPVNDAPQTNDNSTTGNEDSQLIIKLSGSDIDGNVDHFIIKTLPANGTLMFNGVALAVGDSVPATGNTASVTFMPNANWNGSNNFQFAAVDNLGLEDPTPATGTITVNPVNDAPVAVNDGPFSVTEDTPATGNVLTNDTDVDGDVLTVTGFTFGGTTVNAGQSATINGVGSLVINSDGSFTFTPAPNYNGPVPTATYTITDGSITASAKLSFSDVTPVNDAPVAVNDGPVSVTEDTPATGNVLANDSDPEGDALTVTGFTFGGTTVNAGQSATINGVGSLVINSDGSFTFTPAPDYNGPVPTATYTVSDGKLSSTAELSFANVTPVNDAPQTNDNSTTGNEDSQLIIKLSGSDIDGNVDHFIIKTLPANGTLMFNGVALAVGDSVPATGNTASVTFMPNANWNGSNNFQFAAVDNLGLEDPTPATGTITVNPVNDAPVAVNDGPVSVTEDTPATGNVLANDSDPEGDALTVTGFTFGGTTVNAGQSATINGVGSLVINSDGSFTFTPAPNYNGPVPTATYTITDGSITASAKLSFSDVTPVNDAPVAVNDGPVSVTEDTPATGNVLTNDTDVDGDVLTVTGFTFGGTTVNAGQTATVNGVGSLVINSDGSFTFMPAKDYNGPVPTATYTVSDGKLTATADLSFANVTPVNDAPIARPDNATVNEDSSVKINVLANDTDVDGDPLTVTSASAGQGTLTINNDGTLNYTPKANFSGTDTITYTISDGKGGTAVSTVNVNVIAVADKPNLSLDGSNGHPPATGLTVQTWTNLAGLGSNGDGVSPSTLQSVIDNAGKPSSEGSTNSVSNSSVNAGTANKVSGLIFLEAGHTYTFAGVGDDSIRLVIGGNKIAEATWAGSGGTSGKFSGTFTPTESGYYTIALYQHNQSGPGSYNLTISDNGSTPQTVGTGSSLVYHNTSELAGAGERLGDLVGSNGQGHYTVFGVNEGNEDTSIPLSKINASLVDTDGSESLAISIGSIPAGGTLSDGTHSFTADASHTSVDITGWNLSKLTFTPPANANGTITLQVSATATEASNNDKATTTLPLDIQVHAVNDAPTATNQNVAVDEDTVLKGQIVANDVDHDTLSYAVKTGTAHGTLTVDSATGAYTYTPKHDYNGPDSFTVTVSDGRGGSVDSVVNINVTPVNDAPVFTSAATLTTAEDNAKSGQLTATDADGDTITFALKTGGNAQHGNVVVNANGSFTYTPGKDYNGPDSFTVLANDGHGGITEQVIDVNVTPVNDAPNGADATITLNEDSSRPFSAVDFGFSDVDQGDSLSAVRIDSLPTAGSLTFNGKAVTQGQVIAADQLGGLVFTPAANGNGSSYANFTFSVRDSNNAFDPTPNKITFNVTPVNDAPVAVDDSYSISGLQGNYWGYRENVDGANLTNLSQVGAFIAGRAPSATFTATSVNYGNGVNSDLGADKQLQKFLGADAASLNTDPTNTSDAIIQLTGSINLKAGNYQFQVTADDGFSIRIDGVEVFNFDGNQSPTVRQSAVFNIAQSGDHQIEILYWDQGGNAQLKVEMRPQGGTYSVLGGSSLSHPVVSELVTNEDQPLTIAAKTLLGNDTDVDGDTLSIISVQGAVNGTVRLENGNVIFTPTKDYNGTASFTYTISDGNGGVSTATVTLGVNPVNDAPQAKNDSQSTGENSVLSGQVPAATDIDSAVNTTGYALAQGVGAGNGNLVFNANGSYVFDPGSDFDSLNAGESRQVSFSYTAKDAQGAVSVPAVVTITVNGSNDAPTGADKTVTLNEDGSRSFSAADFGFADKDSGDALKAIRIDSLPGAGSLTLNGQSVTAGQVIAVGLLASLVYTPLANAAGNAYATLKFSVQDSHDSFSSSPSTITFNVTPVSDAPVSADGSASLYAGKTYTFGLKDFAFSDIADSANGQSHSLQAVIIKALPDSGTLWLNGVKVTAGQAVSTSDLAGGKLTYVPDASGSNAHFTFAVKDSGGTANGGADTSATYGFDLHVGQVQIPSTTPNGDNTLVGGSGDDVILGDVGGLLTTTQPGTNYNIALIVDTSGSMQYNLAGQGNAAYADSRMKLVKDALINLANELKDHDGVINITLIGFSASASIKVSIADLTSLNVEDLITAIGRTETTGLRADGGTNYQAAFDQAVSWFNAAAQKNNGYENLTLFLTDGDPTQSTSFGNGTATTADVVRESVQSFANLSGVSDVRAIGIGNGINENILKFFDNSNVTGNGTVSFDTSTTSTLHNFSDSSLAGWELASKGNGNGTSIDYGFFTGYRMKMVDSNSNGSTTAASPKMEVTSGTTSSFSFSISETLNTRDTFEWRLEKLVNGTWSTISDSGILDSSTNSATITTKTVGEGTYRFEFILTDNSSSDRATVYVDDVKQTVNTSSPVTGPAGQVDIVNSASELHGALHGGSTNSELAPSGHDTILGGAGDDILFGDSINTDNLPWGVNGNPTKPADLPAGSGVSALSAFLEAKNGHAATTEEMYSYIKANHAQFNVEGDTRGGNDILNGGDGNDILYGQGGNDILIGGDGNDILFGGTGNDQLIGGKGNDILTGGAGADTFIWKAGDTGNDTVTDFKYSEGDRIDISDLLPDTAQNDILSYLKVDTATSTLQVSTTGQVATSADVTIKLSGVDLTTYGSTSSEIVSKLVAGSDPVVKTEHH